MPTPSKGEKKDKFLERCIPIVIADGTAKDGSQANAICNSIWDESKKKKEKKSEEDSMYIKIDEMERRCLPTSELRLDGTETAPKITGYAAVFNTWTDIGGWFKESIRPGAFSKTIKENDIRALMNHNENYVLGRNKAGTLRLKEDSKGLAVEIDPVPATWANDLMTSMKRGDVNQMSFGFQVNKAEADYEKDERVLIDVTLFDVSIVTFPAYPTTSAEVRAAFEHKEPLKVNPPKWEELDRITAKIKASEELTEEELRAIVVYIPNLSIPPAKHMETELESARKPLQPATRKGISQLIIKAELIAPTIRQ